MNCNFHVYLLNDHFSQEYADEKNNGKASELNREYDWEDEYSITTEVQDVVVNDYADYELKGELPSGESFEYVVSNMRLFEVKSGETVTYSGVSESILDSYHIERTDSEINIHIYIKDFEPLANPIPGLYIAAQEFPKELI